MAAGENKILIDVRDHGTALDEKRTRVKCNFCGKVVSSFSRLKCHLGGVRGDVVPCEMVPDNVRESLRNMIMQTKSVNLDKEVGSPDCRKRNSSPNLNGAKHSKFDVSQTASSESRNNGYMASAHKSGKDLKESGNGNVEVQKAIGRFFYESGIDLNTSTSCIFQRMITALHGNSQVNYKMPTLHELKGWILRDEVKEMQEYVTKIKDSWSKTGCSILLDDWLDENGRNIVSFVVECPEGAVYLWSADVSAIVNDVNALQFLLNKVIEQVGSKNVVQIVANSTKGWVAAVGKQFMNNDKQTGIFWSTSTSYCIELMLEKIAAMNSVRDVIANAKIITKFIYSHSDVLKLMRSHIQMHDLVEPSVMKMVMSFLTLENFVSEKENLKNMFASPDWLNSVWASTQEGKRVVKIVNDASFWTAVDITLKGTVPLLRAFSMINEANKPQTAYIYETMDQAKEAIREEFNNKKSQYIHFWDTIDEIWNSHLHSHLHSAGYFLNPVYFYTDDFSCDPEVSLGLFYCIVRMAPADQLTQDLIVTQLLEYRFARGAFEEGSLTTNRTTLSAVQWWFAYGKDCPELQRFAIRIVSQTCNGASRFGLKRDVAEKLLRNGRNVIEQRRLRDLTWLHYNLNLRNKCLGAEYAVVDKEIDPTDDWIKERGTTDIMPGSNTHLDWMDFDRFDIGAKEEGPSE